MKKINLPLMLVVTVVMLLLLGLLPITIVSFFSKPHMQLFHGPLQHGLALLVSVGGLGLTARWLLGQSRAAQDAVIEEVRLDPSLILCEWTHRDNHMVVSKHHLIVDDSVYEFDGAFEKLVGLELNKGVLLFTFQVSTPKLAQPQRTIRAHYTAEVESEVIEMVRTLRNRYLF